jgi:hypothetical protein
MISYAALSLLTLSGLIILFRRKSDIRWPVAVHPLIFPVVYYITHTAFEYRLPIDPVVVVLAAVALGVLARGLVPKRFSLFRLEATLEGDSGVRL